MHACIYMRNTKTRQMYRRDRKEQFSDKPLEHEEYIIVDKHIFNSIFNFK